MYVYIYMCVCIHNMYIYTKVMEVVPFAFLVLPDWLKPQNIIFLFSLTQQIVLMPTCNAVKFMSGTNTKW